MTNDQNTNERSMSDSTPRFDVALFITKNFNKLSDETVARLAVKNAYMTQKQIIEKDCLHSVCLPS